MTNDLFERIKEHRDRPEAVKALKDMLNISRVFLASASNMSEDEQIFTDVELKTLEKLISDTQVRNFNKYFLIKFYFSYKLESNKILGRGKTT